MKNSIIIPVRFLALMLIAWILPIQDVLCSEPDTAGKVMVYKFDIKKEIAPPVWRSTKMAVEEAIEMKADLILIEMSTYGGMLESADSIRTKLLESPIPVFVFIDHNAASAGALLPSLATASTCRPALPSVQQPLWTRPARWCPTSTSRT